MSMIIKGVNIPDNAVAVEISFVPKPETLGDTFLDSIVIDRADMIQISDDHGDIKDVGPLDSFMYECDGPNDGNIHMGVDLVLDELDKLPALLSREFEE